MPENSLTNKTEGINLVLIRMKLVLHSGKERRSLMQDNGIKSLVRQKLIVLSAPKVRLVCQRGK